MTATPPRRCRNDYKQQDTPKGLMIPMMTNPVYSTPLPLKPSKPTKRRHRTRRSKADRQELATLRKRCAQQRRELERLKAIITVASTSDVESVIIVKATDGKADE